MRERRKIQDSQKKEMFHQILRNQIILTAILWTGRSVAAENHILRQEDNREQEKGDKLNRIVYCVKRKKSHRRLPTFYHWSKAVCVLRLHLMDANFFLLWSSDEYVE